MPHSPTSTLAPSSWRWALLTWRQYRLERRMFWRNPTAAFFNFFLPLVFLGLFGAVFASDQAVLNVIVPGIAGMSVLATTFSALAYNLTFLREQGILKRIRGTPLPSSAYLAAIITSAITNAVFQVALITLAGKLFFGVSWPQDWPELLIFTVLGVACFAALGIAFAHMIPNFDSASAYINAVFLPMILISGVFYDVDKVPAFVRVLAMAMPLTHLIDGLSDAIITGTGLLNQTTALAILIGWTVVGLVAAVRKFSWE